MGEVKETKKQQVLPIVIYGDPILKRPAEDIDENFEGLSELIDKMFETMESAEGVGLAAPQIGLSKRIFVIDASATDEKFKGFKRVFINPEIIEVSGETYPYEEGCLSIPGIRENVSRAAKVLIGFYDENFNYKEEEFSEMPARIVLHEYDHIEGILFTDRLSSLKKRLIKKKLENVAKGRFTAKYPVKVKR